MTKNVQQCNKPPISQIDAVFNNSNRFKHVKKSRPKVRKICKTKTKILNWTNTDNNKTYPGYVEYWYNEATNQTKWEKPIPPTDGSSSYTSHELDFFSFSRLCKKRNILKVK